MGRRDQDGGAARAARRAPFLRAGLRSRRIRHFYLQPLLHPERARPGLAEGKEKGRNGKSQRESNSRILPTRAARPPPPSLSSTPENPRAIKSPFKSNLWP